MRPYQVLPLWVGPENNVNEAVLYILQNSGTVAASSDTV